jgi:hypothetical protein
MKRLSGECKLLKWMTKVKFLTGSKVVLFVTIFRSVLGSRSPSLEERQPELESDHLLLSSNRV